MQVVLHVIVSHGSGSTLVNSHQCSVDMYLWGRGSPLCREYSRKKCQQKVFSPNKWERKDKNCFWIHISHLETGTVKRAWKECKGNYIYKIWNQLCHPRYLENWHNRLIKYLSQFSSGYQFLFCSIYENYVLASLFNGMSTFMGYLMPKLSL